MSAQRDLASGAELLVDALIDSGVETVFGVPGDTGVAFYDVLYQRQDEIRHVLARDERHAAIMADAYARSTGTVGAVEVSSGGGCSYVVGGLAEAYAAAVPVLVIASDIHAGSRGTGALTELDQVALFSAVTKSRVVAESAEVLPRVVKQALITARSGRPAPVAVIVPENVLDEHGKRQRPSGTSSTSGRLDTPYARASAPDDAIAHAASLLNGAARPAIVAGSGVHWSRAWQALAVLTEAARIPVATTIHGKGAISEDSEWYLGIVGGNSGSPHVNEYLSDADVTLFVGTRANATDTNSWRSPSRSSTVIQIDIDPSSAGRNFPGSTPLVGDARTVLEQLAAAVRPAAGRQPAKRAASRDVLEDENAEVELLGAGDVTRVVRAAVGDRAHLVLADPGTPTPYVATEWYTPEPGRTVLIPRGHGPMGWALPGAIGAAIAHPDVAIVSFIGDGSFAMSCGELETACRLNLPIIFVQLTNFSLGWIKMLQHLYHEERYFSVDPGPIDAVMVAQASGLDAARPRSLAELRSLVTAGLEKRQPLYIDVAVRHMIDEVPMVSSWQAALQGDRARPVY